MELWVAPIFALIGTLVGGLIPAVTTFKSNKASTKEARIDKHERFIRKLMIEFVRPTWIAYNASDNTFVYKDLVKKQVKSVNSFYEEEIVNNSPLELLDLITNITNAMERIDFALESENSVSPKTIPKVLSALNDEREILKREVIKLERKVKRKFI